MTTAAVGPEVRILEHSPEDNFLCFELRNVDVSYANALRRALIAEVSETV